MFEAGFFGTIEDLFLGAKGGVENFSRGIGEKLSGTKSGSSSGKCIIDVDNDQYQYAKESFKEELKDIDSKVVLEMYTKNKANQDTHILYVISEQIVSRSGGLEWISKQLSDSLNMSFEYVFSKLKDSDFNKQFGVECDTAVTIEDYDFMKGLKENPFQYFEMSDDVKNIISDIDSGKISQEKGFEMLKQLPDPNIVLDMKKLIDDADSFMKAMKTEIPESVTEMPVKSDADKEKDTVTLEEAITSTGIGKRLFSRMEETPAVAG